MELNQIEIIEFPDLSNTALAESRKIRRRESNRLAQAKYRQKLKANTGTTYTQWQKEYQPKYREKDWNKYLSTQKIYNATYRRKLKEKQNQIQDSILQENN